MADYIQIGMICESDLESDEQKEWLENLSNEQNRNFVEVTEGDASKVYSFDQNEVLSLDQLLNSEYCAASHVAIDRVLTDAEDVARLDAARERSNAASWSGVIYYSPSEA